MKDTSAPTQDWKELESYSGSLTTEPSFLALMEALKRLHLQPPQQALDVLRSFLLQTTAGDQILVDWRLSSPNRRASVMLHRTGGSLRVSFRVMCVPGRSYTTPGDSDFILSLEEGAAVLAEASQPSLFPENG